MSFQNIKIKLTAASPTLSSPNFLILDEPTNHLDVATVEALGKALSKFKVQPIVDCGRAIISSLFFSACAESVNKVPTISSDA